MLTTRQIHFFGQEYQGMAILNGIAFLEADSVRFEYSVKDAILGVVKSSIKKIRIPFDSIQRVEFLTNLFRTRLRIHVSDFVILNQYPDVEDDFMNLRIKRKNKKEASQFVSSLQLALSEYRLKQLDLLDQ